MPVEINAALVKELRDKTGAGIKDCKDALEKNEGSVPKAADYLRQRGAAQADKKADRATSEGAVGSYIHMGGKIGVLIEVNCETDFVARTDDFQTLVQQLALQVCAMKPDFVTRDEVPQDKIADEMAGYKAAALEEGKKEEIAEKMAKGRVDKYFAERCLYEQDYIKDPNMKVEDLIKAAIAKCGENIKVRRFVRFSLGN